MIGYISRLPEAGPPFPRRVTVMGSTGSIGVNTLAVMAANPDKLQVVALAAGKNAALLAEQAEQWRPGHLAVLDSVTHNELCERLEPLRRQGYSPEIHIGPEGYAFLASMAEAEFVVSAQVGAAGLAATYAAVVAGKFVALANKESLVLAGSLLRREAASSGAVILPVDSEHNAIFQCLAGHGLTGGHEDSPGKGMMNGVSRLILTASGGPFRGRTAGSIESATPAMALAHPNWTMGAKITIDSATMMNKGLEVIEAHHLYGFGLEVVDVLVHPQSVVHSLVEFKDASLLAQAGPADMRIAISHCLGWPERIESRVPFMNLTSIAALTFEKPDVSVFRCLALARESASVGKGLPVVLNAANEVAVEAFLAKRLPFGGIARLVERAMNAYNFRPLSGEPTSLEEIMDLDSQARIVSRECM